MNRATIACLLVVAGMTVMTMACERPPVEDGVVLSGVALAGPTCPVERDPPDPECEDRPVVGAQIVILDARAEVVARVQTDVAGRFTVTLAPGEYQVVPQPVEGLMGTAGATVVVVAAGADPEPLTLLYDTGIR